MPVSGGNAASTGAPWLRILKDAVEVQVRVVPRASRDGIAGIHGDSLRLQITAPPVDGEANRRVIELLAKLAKQRPASVTLVSGAASRSKRVRIACDDPQHVARILEAAARDAGA